MNQTTSRKAISPTQSYSGQRRLSTSRRSATPLMIACSQGLVKEIEDLLPKSVLTKKDRTGKTALHYCTDTNDAACAELIINADSSIIDYQDDEGYTALHLAVINGNVVVARLLIDKGANCNKVDKEKHSVVHWATVCGEIECLNLLLEVGADAATADIHGAYPLHYAAQMCGSNSEMGNDTKVGLAVLSKLLQVGLDVNVKDQDGRQPLLWAASAETRPSKTYCTSGSSDAILALINAGASVTSEDKDGLNALHCSASRGHVDCMETLICLCGAECDVIDNNGCTPLFYSVTLGHADCTELLLQYGSDPNRQDRKGRTPAHCGASKGQLETLRLLSQHGANMWAKNIKGDVPLHEAVQSGRKDLVKWLLIQRNDLVNLSNNDGRTGLHLAAINSNVEMCKVLMDYKAVINPIMRNRKGILVTPLDSAVSRGNKSCAKYLQLHGGVPAAKLIEKYGIHGAVGRIFSGKPELAKDIILSPGSNSASMDSNFENMEKKSGNSTADSQGSAIRRVKLRTIQTNRKTIHRERMITQQQNTHDHQSRTDVHVCSSGNDAVESEHVGGEPSFIVIRPSAQEGSDEQVDGTEDDNNLPEGENSSGKPQQGGGEMMSKCFIELPRIEYSEAVEKTEDVTDEKKEIDSNENKGIEDKSGKDNETQKKVSNDVKVSKTKDSSEEEQSKDQKERERDNSIQLENDSNDHKLKDRVEVHEEEIKKEEGPPDLTQEKAVERKNNEKEHSDLTQKKVVNRENIEKEGMVENSDNSKTRKTKDQSVKTVKTVKNLKKSNSEIELKKNKEKVNKKIQSDDEQVYRSSKFKQHRLIKRNENRGLGSIANRTFRAEEHRNGAVSVLSNHNGSEASHATAVHKDSGYSDDLEERYHSDAADISSTTSTDCNAIRKVRKRKTKYKQNSQQRAEVQTPKTHEAVIIGTADVQNDESPILAVYRGEHLSKKDEAILDNKEDVFRNKSRTKAHRRLSEDSVKTAPHTCLDQPAKKTKRITASTVSGTSFTKHKRSMERKASTASLSKSSVRSSRSVDPPRRTKVENSKTNQRISRSVDFSRSSNSGNKYKSFNYLTARYKPAESKESAITSMNKSMRKYFQERQVFQKLLEVKRLQIRCGRANEQVLVKRLVDDHAINQNMVGIKPYTGQLSLKAFERYLYNVLREFSASNREKVPVLKNGSQYKSFVLMNNDVQDNTDPSLCTNITHKCNHAIDAYTSYPGDWMTHDSSNKGTILPKLSPAALKADQIVSKSKHRLSANRLNHELSGKTRTITSTKSDSAKPVTFEIKHGSEKNVFTLPTDEISNRKKWQVTFTIGVDQNNKNASLSKDSLQKLL